MTASIFDGTFLSVGVPTLRAVWVVCLSLLVALIAALCRGQTAPGKDLPRVLMIERHGSDTHDAGLYKAIRAQLSASPLILERVELEREQAMMSDPLQRASRLASEHHAAVVFWIEIKEACRLYFYMPDESGGRINSRAINLDLNSQSSRFEVIAVVASGMIEGLLVSHNLKAPAPSQKQNPPPAPAVEKEKAKRNRKWIEIFMAYTGSFLATDLVSHGGTLGLGLFPIDRLVVAASFTQNWPERFVSEDLRLKVISRQIEVLAAGRISIHPIDVRLGVSWSVDLRSFSTTSLSETIDARPDGFISVHSLVPFLFAGWMYRARIGVFGRVGANLALNETVYRVSRNGPTKAFKPFFAKLFYQFGLVVWI